MKPIRMSRRAALKTGLAATAFASLPDLAKGEGSSAARKGRIRQAVCRWCYKDIPLDRLCAYGAEIGLKGIDLLEPEEYEVPRRYGLICTMAYAGAGTIPDALNRLENHAAIEANLRTNIPLAAKAGIPDVITFSGNRRGMSDDEGARNIIAGLNRVKKIAEDNGVILCLELLNSKVNHPDYMCDHTAWGVRVMRGSEFAECEAALRHLPHADYGGRPDRDDHGEHRVDCALPYRRRARTP